MSDLVKKDLLKYDGSINKSDKGEVILGRLTGPVAEFIAPTRNDRMYDESTWDAVFKKPLVKEMFESGGLLGELNHPEDRLETDLSKVCVCMPSPPEKADDGSLVASFDILDTPNGRIVATLAKYGYKLGVSSRADGDVYEGWDGKDHVNPDTFDLKGFDIVLIPAVKKARLSLEESLRSKDFKKALLECIDSSSSEDKEIMKQSLSELDIDLSTEQEDVKDEEAVDSRSELVVQLQEALEECRSLKQQVSELQSKISVCRAKEDNMNEELSRYKHSVTRLSERLRDTSKVAKDASALSEKLAECKRIIANKDKKIATMLEAAKVSSESKKKLLENVSSKQKTLDSLQAELEEARKSFAEERQSLLENIEDTRKDMEIQSSKYVEQLDKSLKLVEHYKKIAKESTDRYIASKASMLGVSSQEIKNRLSEKYTFEDIDSICEDLKSYKLNISRLPFDISKAGTSFVVSESREPIKPKTPGVDDEVDNDLLRLAGLI